MSKNKFPTEEGWYTLKLTFKKNVDMRKASEACVRSLFPGHYLFELGKYEEKSSTKATIVARKVELPIKKDIHLILPTSVSFILVFPWNESSTQPYDHWLEEVKEHAKHPSTFKECMEWCDQNNLSYEHIDHVNNVLSYT